MQRHVPSELETNQPGSATVAIDEAASLKHLGEAGHYLGGAVENASLLQMGRGNVVVEPGVDRSIVTPGTPVRRVLAARK